MRLKSGKIITLLLAFMLAVPMFWQMNTSVVSAAAASPKFSKSQVTITDVGDTYKLVIKNQVKGSKYKYTTSKKKVAKVSSKGVVTSVGSGTTTISCKITYPTKKTKTITCKVTVTIPADVIAINNETEVNGAHVLSVGSTYDFEYDLTPANSSDLAYWYVEKGNCITVNNATGVVTAVKAGKATLRVKAVKKSTQAEAKKSIVDDAIIIEVVAPKAEVKSATITSSNEITVVFDSPVDKSTVIDTAGKLTSNIKVSLGKDIKNVLADDPGTLTPILSSDLRTLTITTAKALNGYYTIEFTTGIKTSDGKAMEEYYTTLTYNDTIPPVLVGSSVDDTGFINILQFSEAIDSTNLKVSNVQVTNNATADSSTLSIVGNRLNYIISKDKKSLTLNLSSISSMDYNKSFTLILSGVKDMAGNVPATAYFATSVRTDTNPKPQAVPYSLVRTSYNVLTATFNRAIKSPGQASINGATIAGVIDAENDKKVNYIMADAEATLTGSINVSLVNWSSYNVSNSDTSAYTPKVFQVNFTSDSTSPYLTTYDYDAATTTLTLTFTEAVTLVNPAGVFTASLKTLTDETFSGTNISYTKLNSDKDNILKLKLSNINTLGTYTFEMIAGFVTDGFKNRNLSRMLTISTVGSNSSELPAPFSIAQSNTNLSQINVDFAHRIDEASAQNVANYSITGVTIISATVTKNNNESGATVLLTVAENTIDVTVERPMTIKGIKGYNSSYSAMTGYKTTITLRENKRPNYINSTYNRTNNSVSMNFDEEMAGSVTVKITLLSTGSEIGTTSVLISGKAIQFGLAYVPASGTNLRIQIINNDLKDLNGNASSLSSVYMCTVSY